MKKLSLILTLLLFGSLTSVMIPSPAKCEWSTPTQLTDNTGLDLHPSVNGDGTETAFHSDVDGDDEVFVVNSDGSGLTQLTFNTALDRIPSISGDGTKIAFRSKYTGKI